MRRERPQPKRRGLTRPPPWRAHKSSLSLSSPVFYFCAALVLFVAPATPFNAPLLFCSLCPRGEAIFFFPSLPSLSRSFTNSPSRFLTVLLSGALSSSSFHEEPSVCASGEGLFSNASRRHPPILLLTSSRGCGDRAFIASTHRRSLFFPSHSLFLSPLRAVCAGRRVPLSYRRAPFSPYSSPTPSSFLLSGSSFPFSFTFHI